MIDKLQRIAVSVRILKIPAIVVGIVCLGAIAVAVLGLRAAEANGYIEPAFIGLIWALATHSFIATFETIPAPVDQTLGFIAKMKRRASRGWYWLIALVFIGTTGFALVLSGRLLSIWLRA